MEHQLSKPIDPADVEAARRQTFAQKFLAGAELFDYACAVTEMGIRMQHPEFNDEHVRTELRQRIAMSDRLEDERLRSTAIQKREHHAD
jgi:hypothetical protein